MGSGFRVLGFRFRVLGFRASLGFRFFLRGLVRLHVGLGLGFWV